MAHFDISIKPKLAETALLFCRVSHFCQKWNNEPKLVLLVSDSTARIHSEASKEELSSKLHVHCHFVVEGVLGARKACFVPRPSTPLVGNEARQQTNMLGILG